jgi:hypothetical protein
MQKMNGGTARVAARAPKGVIGATSRPTGRGDHRVLRRRIRASANSLMTFGVPSGFVAEAVSDAEPSFGANSARDLTANRCAEIFSDLQHPRKEQWTIRNSTG